MVIKMNWDEWCQAYPVRVVDQKPITIELHCEFVDRSEAEHVKEFMEIDYECGGMEIVQFEDKFYIVWAD